MPDTPQAHQAAFLKIWRTLIRCQAYLLKMHWKTLLIHTNRWMQNNALHVISSCTITVSKVKAAMQNVTLDIIGYTCVGYLDAMFRVVPRHVGGNIRHQPTEMRLKVCSNAQGKLCATCLICGGGLYWKYQKKNSRGSVTTPCVIPTSDTYT